jgi:hypothetical protein
MEPESKTRDILTKIVSSNYELGEKMKKIIVPACLNVVLTLPAKEALFKFIGDNGDLTTYMLKLIEEALTASKISMYSDEVVQVKSYNVFMSSVIEEVETRLADPKVKDVRIYGTNVFVDCSMNGERCRGIDFAVGAGKVLFEKSKDGNRVQIRSRMVTVSEIRSKLS